MNVHFAYPAGVLLQPWEGAFREQIRAHFAKFPSDRYQLVDAPAAAEIIVLLESNQFRTQRDITVLEADPILREFPDRVFTINYEDYPAGFLPGLYAALSTRRYDPVRHAAWCYLFPPNPHVYQSQHIARAGDDAMLFSFRGAASHISRERLFALKIPPGMNARITRVDRWYDHTKNEQVDYVAEILGSHFVLCPRGLAPASHRLFEVMALGRCPVIIGDEWIAPEAVNWDACAIRIAESDVGKLPALLASRQGEAAELGLRARAEWERNFSPRWRFEAALDAIVRLRDRRPSGHDERAYQNAWHSRRFHQINGWTLEQRMARKFGRVWRKLRRR